MGEFLTRSGPTAAIGRGTTSRDDDARPAPAPPVPPVDQLASRIARDVADLDDVATSIDALAFASEDPRPATARRAAYDQTHASATTTLDRIAARLTTHQTFAAEHQLSNDTPPLTALAQQLAATRAALASAPPPARFAPIAEEAALAALVEQRTTGPEARQAQAAEINAHLEALAPRDRRRLAHRLAAPDPEDQLARGFARLVEWGPRLRGVLAGTHRLRFPTARPSPAGTPAAPSPDAGASGDAASPAATPTGDADAPAADTDASTAPQASAASGDDARPSGLPHRAQMEALFQQSFADVQVTTDPDLAARGIRGAAAGDQVRFATAEPAIDLVAHELTHVAQQRRAGTTTTAHADESQPTDAAEVEARDVAAQVRAGNLAPVTVQARPAAAVHFERDAAPAAADAHLSALAYFDRNLSLILSQIRQRFTAAPWPLGHARIAWVGDLARVAAAVTDRLLALTGGHAADRMPLFPSYWPTADLWTLIDQHRTVTGEPGAYVDGKPTARGAMRPDTIANEAAALEFVAGLRASFTRMVPRFVAAADDHRPEPVPADQLVTSAPLDRIWAGILTDRALVHHTPPTGAAGEQATPTGPGTFRGGVRPVTFEWMGPRDPKLWNVVRVTAPTDATAEEVAAAIYQYPGSDTVASHHAFAIVDAAPFFVLPRSWAKDLPDAVKYATRDTSSTLGEPTDAILTSAAFDQAALAQGADEAAHPLGRRGKASHADGERLMATLDRTRTQLAFTAEQLTPWQLTPQVDAASAWVAQRIGGLAGEDPATIARWAPVIEAQSRTVTEATGAVADILATAGRAGINPRTPDAGPFRHALGAYVAALATAHLADVARARLGTAHAARDQLVLAFAQSALADAGLATEDLREAEGGSFDLSTEAGTLTRERRHLQRDALGLRATSLAGEGIDATELERITIDAQTVTLKARAHELAMKARHLASALGAARSTTTMNKVAAGFDARFDTIPGRLAELATDCELVEAHLREHVQAEGLALRPAATPEESAAQMRRMLDAKRAALAAGQQELADLPARHGLDRLNRSAMDAIEDNQIAALAINVAILIAASIATSGVAAAAGGAARAGAVVRLGMSVESAAVVGAGVDVAIDSALTAVVQSAVMGGDVRAGLVENLLANAAIRASLARFAPLMAGLDDEVSAAWQAEKVGDKVAVSVAKGAAVGAELITAAGVGYVAQRLVHGKQPPSDDQVAGWFIQGASMAAGRAIGARTAQLQARLARAGARHVFDSAHGDAYANVRQRIAAQIALSQDVEASGDADGAMRLLIENRKLLDSERDLLQHLADEPGRAESLGVSRQDVATFQRDNRAAAADLGKGGMDVLPLRLAGVDELVPGALWSGTGEQIATAMFQAREVGLAVRVFDVGNERKRWRVALGDSDRVIEIQERPAPRHRGPVAKEARAILQAKAAAEIAKVRVSQVPKPGASLHYAVTPADGARLIELFRSLDGAEVIEYKKGIVVRHTGREWYVEFTDQAHTVDGASRATAIGADDGGIGLPESNVATVELWGYRGGRTIRGKKVKATSADEQAEYKRATDADKLLWAGHVGVSLDGGRTIYGFTPEKPEGMTMAEFERRLKQHESFPGKFADDTASFVLAREKAEQGWNTEPERVIVVMEKPQRSEVLQTVVRLMGMKAGEHGFRYGFPLEEPDTGGAFRGTDEHPATCVRNCAAFPEKIGVPLPEPTGRMEHYMPELKKWIEADAPVDARNANEEGAP